MTVGSALHGGSESYVAATKTRTGGEAVVKIEMPPYASFGSEVRTLIAADGRGYVRLLEHDEGRKAMLQERLGVPLSECGLSIPTQIGVLCTTLRRAWEVPAPAGLLEGEARYALWVIALVLEYTGPVAAFWTPGLGRSTTADWTVEGGHFAERCRLFVILALGSRSW